MEEEAIQHHQHLRQSLAQTEHSYRALCNMKPGFTLKSYTKSCNIIRLRKHRRSLYLLPKDSVLSTRCVSKLINGKVLYEMFLNGERLQLSKSALKL